MASRTRVMGVHPFAAEEPVHLIEIEVGENAEFDFREITQETPGQPRSDWQVAYDQRELATKSLRVLLSLLGYGKAVTQLRRPA